MNATVQIHLNRLLNNLNLIKAQLDGDQKIFAVVKNEAYGHGMIGVADFLKDKVYGFCLARIEEAIAMREAGITNPLLVLEVPEKKDAQLYKKHSIMASVSDLTAFENLESGTEYHLNFNTGMNRLGFRVDELDDVKHWVAKRSDCVLKGIYTHFFMADDPNAFEVEQQFSAFSLIRKEFPSEIMAHASNSGGIFHYKSIGSHLDAVRPGMALYGYTSGDSEIVGLQPILELKSKVVQVNPIKKGESVSYGAKWTAPENGFVATIPVGYNAGISRQLSGKIQVNIEGKMYPQVGTISMDYMMVFLGDDEIPTGAEVELLGAESMSAGDWANLTGTISYEVLTQLNWLMPRIYHY